MINEYDVYALRVYLRVIYLYAQGPTQDNI